MAGLLGEGGVISLSGTFNSATPATLADFTPTGGQIQKGPDGRGCNVYSLTLVDTSSSYLLAVRVSGLQENGTASKATCIPGVPQPFQITEHANDLRLVQGWLTNNAGADFTTTATASSATVIGFVMVRRE